jgi:RimJ/RimL family protein N-acetyltransferase
MSADDAFPPVPLAESWPIFALRIRTERLEIRLPTDDELLALVAVAASGIHPPDQMPFEVPWTDKPRPRFEREFLQHHWLMRATWMPDSWALNLGIFLDGAVIGSQTIRALRFGVFRTVDTGSWLGRSYQGRGYGKEMRAGILAFAFDGLDARFADSGAFVDNAASNGVSRSIGYAENGRDELAPRGVPRAHQRWRMTAEAWRSRPRPPVVIEGLDACRELFGA